MTNGQPATVATPLPAVVELGKLVIPYAPTFPLECVLWLAFAVSLVAVVARRARAGASRADAAWLVAWTTAGLCFRAAVSFVPQNWYFAIANAPFPPEMAMRTTVFQPLPPLALLANGWGIEALRILNCVVGTAAIPLLGAAASNAGYPKRTTRIFVVLAAVVPFYVRYSAMDGPQIVILFLFAAASFAYTSAASRPRRGVLPEAVLVFTAVVLAAPIRPESAWPLLSVPFFLFHGRSARSLRGLWHGPVTMVLVVAWLLGCWWALAVHLSDLTGHPGADALKVAIRALVTATMMINPGVVAWVPLVLLVPIWMHVAHLVRCRLTGELLSLYAPVVFCAVPLVAVGPQNHLVGLGYVIVQSVFVLLACARCTDAVLGRVDAGELLAPSGRGRVVFGGIMALAIVSFVPPLTYRYAFQDEFLFLRDALPKGPATVLTISDVWADGPGDFDCCLLQPYAPIMMERPDLSWIILRKRALDDGRFRGLTFDYYYPGSMAAADPESVDRFFIRRIARWLGAPEDEEAIRKKAHLEAIAELDRRIRETYAFETVRADSVPTHVFSDAGFPDGRLSLTLYRRTGRAD